jgi:hypothetical protein
LRKYHHDEKGVSYFDVDHYIKVRKAREEKGLPVKDEPLRVDHELLGEKFFYDDDMYEVSYATKNWFWGYYITLTLTKIKNKSSKCIIWDNISSSCPDIIDIIKSNKKKYSKCFV